MSSAICTSCRDTPALVRGLCARCNGLILVLERTRDDARQVEPEPEPDESPTWEAYQRERDIARAWRRAEAGEP